MTPENCRDKNMPENADRRTGLERRRFAYSAYIPERRSGKERRKCARRKRPRADMKRKEKSP